MDHRAHDPGGLPAGRSAALVRSRELEAYEGGRDMSVRMRPRLLVLLALCIAFAVALMPALGAAGSRTEVAMLKKITSRVSDRAGVISIEASDPVPYVASQPDPRTFVVELRDVVALGFADNFSADPRNPVSAVQVEGGVAVDGVAMTRIRMTLTQPMRPRVRSSRNMIFVEADRFDRTPATAGIVSAAGPADPFSALTHPGTSAAPAPVPQVRLAAAQAPAAPARQPAPSPAVQTPAPQAPAAPASGPQSPSPTVGTPGRYTGHTVSLDFQGADLRAVLRTFAEISGLNIVIDPTIQGTVDVALRDVPWDQALDIILRANKLGYLVDGTIVRIAPLGVLADEESQRRKLSDEQALSGELRTVTRSLSYAKAEDLRPLLTATVLSQRGSIQTDARTNTIIITDLGDRLTRAADLLTTLDRPEPQVEIEARIVQTTREFSRILGVQWGFNGRASQGLGNTLPLAFPNQGGITGRTGAVQGAPGESGADAANTAVNLGVSGASSAIGLALGSVNGAVNLDVALSALERQGQGRLLSTPRVSTQNNVEAEITQGVQIPIQTVANNTVTVTFKDAALTLRVTPQITAADTVIMRISVENAAPDFSRSVNNIPPIDTQRALTQVLVSNGETTVIGGIYVSREQAAEDRTPGLHRLPLLGWLFKRDSVTDESRELLIFITPKIIRL
jgi:type IV pilus secretin PilQ/predicted competence protein